MEFKPDSKVFEGAYASMNILGTIVPVEYSGAKSETLAARETAWLGTALNMSPVYDVWGKDAAELFNHLFVNKDFSEMAPGTSKHGVMCNRFGRMIADGVVMYKGDNVWRTYWLAPCLQYFVEKSELDVHGAYETDEYFFQIDGPKSLEILEEATETDLHDIKFAKNKTVKICGTDMVVHRLGMSGCLAYEVHGKAEDAEVVYDKLREVTEKHGGKPQGFRNYVILNHTPGGYPNQFQHFCYALYEDDPEFAAWAKEHCVPQFGTGSAIVDQSQFYVTPYDIGWGYLINTNHEFVGKEALMAYKEIRPKKMVTLEWNADDVAEVFASQFRGTDVKPYEPIETYHDSYNGSQPIPTRGSYVLSDGAEIGIATGRCYSFYTNRMISLACIKKEYSAEGTEVKVLWGTPPEYPQKEIRATVVQFPYFDGDWRNETCDVDKMVPKKY